MTLASNKVRLIQVAKRRTGMVDADYRAMLARIGGVDTSRDLDADGFEGVMAHFRQLGFVSDFAKGTFGDRPGYASPAQVRLARKLWGEFSPTGTDVEFRAWLERYHGVSSLRFATTEKAGAIITALKAMAARAVAAREEKPAGRRTGADG